jgi:acyl-CoA reductase-like NAD-dependent aldehyde dehydrogenase
VEYKLFIDGEWVGGEEYLEVQNKYTLETIGVLPKASREQVDAAIAAAERAAPIMADMPPYRRSEILGRAAVLIHERKEDLARTIAAEAGKALKFARIDRPGLQPSQSYRNKRITAKPPLGAVAGELTAFGCAVVEDAAISANFLNLVATK